MPTNRKLDVINNAYEEIRISGLTVSANPADLVMALNRLETMMAEWYGNRNINIGYNFQDTPTFTAVTNVAIQYYNTMVTNLAVRLLAAFGKDPSQTLAMNATQSLSATQGQTALQNARMVQPSRRMPSGSGNTFRWGWGWNRFMIPVALPPAVSETNNIIQGEIQDKYEDFSAWLGSNTIASYTIQSTPLLETSNDAINGTRIDYRVTAPVENSGQGPWQIVLITVTDSIGRINIRPVDYVVIGEIVVTS
jgi:hypothetical protein